jgi:aspartyl-tRNA(Asn)/glutamyl-tRNA(Gln) amidotransferase subunit C
MALTTEEVRKIASLARLRFTPEEEATFAGQLGKIVDYIDQLQRLDAGEPTPPSGTANAAPEADDVARPCLPREAFLANAPAALDGFLLVPEVKAGPGDDGPS